jgi:selenocysteine lyase/cysteine desulfurase
MAQQTIIDIYAGAGQYTSSQIRATMEELVLHGYGNPHSRSASSARSTAEVAAARQSILQHFNADPADYYVIFIK